MGLRMNFTNTTTGEQHANAYALLSRMTVDRLAPSVALHVDIYPHEQARRDGRQPIFGMDFTVSNWMERVERWEATEREELVPVDVPVDPSTPDGETITEMRRQLIPDRELVVEEIRHDDLDAHFADALADPPRASLVERAYSYLAQRPEFEGASAA